MTWKREQSADSLPVWSGSDSIYNVEKEKVTNNGCGAVAGAFIIVISLFLFAVTLSEWMDGNQTVMPVAVVTGPLILIMMAFAAYWIWLFFNLGPLKFKDWLRHDWRLTASQAGFAYQGRESWAVDLGDVARVETSKTHEWEKVRDYGRLIGAKIKIIDEIPSGEYQTFLVLRDTSRRVIYTANADREGCATLAHSIREYLESVRPASAPAVAAGPAASPAGFDL